MSKPVVVTGGVAGAERRAARRAFWLFVAVAIVATAQVGWWLIVQVRATRELAELKQADLQAQAYLLDEALNSDFASLWYSLDSTVHDTAWDGTLKRSVSSHAAVLGTGGRPPVNRAQQGAFGTVDNRLWTWSFTDVEPHLFVKLDHMLPGRMIARNGTDLRFSGNAPAPGLQPWPAKRRATEIDPLAIDRIEEERRRALVMFSSESAFFVFLIIMGVYLMYRSVRQSANLRKQQQNFIAAVTHELKAPLASVKLYAETLERPEIPRPDQEKYLGRMQQDISRLEQLIDDILMAGRLDEKASRLNLKPTDFSRDTGEYVRSLQDYLERHNFVLRTEVAPGLKAVTDYDAMRRVIGCLVENSVKYSDSRREADLRLQSVSGHLELSVQDYGVGVAAEETEKVFQAFYRVGDEMTRTIAGTGLGLYLVREIVASHGGTVKLRSDGPGKGTTITITLKEA